MKKYLILILAAASVLVSCGKEPLNPGNGNETVQTAPVTFNLTANHPDATKAVKTGWESGDAIFVFFTGAAAPKHLKMTYNGSTWTSAEYDGATQMAGALGLKNGNSKRAKQIEDQLWTIEKKVKNDYAVPAWLRDQFVDYIEDREDAIEDKWD